MLYILLNQSFGSILNFWSQRIFLGKKFGENVFEGIFVFGNLQVNNSDQTRHKEMMKRLIICLLVIFTTLVAMSQVPAYREYNKYHDREEFFDKSGNKIGYVEYNKYHDRLEYRDKKMNIVMYGEINKYRDRWEIRDKQYNIIYYKTWNKYRDRWEIRDKHGNLVMYCTWNKYRDRWEYEAP